MNPPQLQKDTPAWILFVWLSFSIAMLMMVVGIYYAPISWWVRGYFYMGTLFMVGSTFTLAKTIRDNFEAQKMINRVVDAKTEKILHDYELKSA
jgi:hypothetical protein